MYFISLHIFKFNTWILGKDTVQVIMSTLSVTLVSARSTAEAAEDALRLTLYLASKFRCASNCIMTKSMFFYHSCFISSHFEPRGQEV